MQSDCKLHIIKSNIDILKLIKSHINLHRYIRKDGRIFFKGNCIFNLNDEKCAKNHFSVDQKMQRFLCYDCIPQGGDVVDFFAYRKNISRDHAIHNLYELLNNGQLVSYKKDTITICDNLNINKISNSNNLSITSNNKIKSDRKLTKLDKFKEELIKTEQRFKYDYMIIENQLKGIDDLLQGINNLLNNRYEIKEQDGRI